MAMYTPFARILRAILWHTDVGGRGTATSQKPNVAPIIADGLVFGVNGAGRVYALRASDGARAWSSDIAPPMAWTVRQRYCSRTARCSTLHIRLLGLP